MRVLFISLIVVLTSLTIKAQTDNPVYTKALADSLGADELGMKNYFFVILKTGHAETDDKEKVASAFRGHLDNISAMVKNNKLIVAGPFGENDLNYRGLYIFDVPALEELNALLETDPAIKAGYLEPEIIQWYGSAALPMYLKYSERITLKDF